MRSVEDGLGRKVSLASPPARVVSLVPSTTETLHGLGRAQCVVGRTSFCIHPAPWVETVPEVGGTKDPDLDRIAALHPDLIFANREENRPELLSDLEAIAPLYVAFPRTVDEALEDLVRTAQLLGVADEGRACVRAIEAQRCEARREAVSFRFACLIWRRPWMVAGADTFGSALLAELGGCNVFGAERDRYARVTVEEVVAACPDVVMLPSEPFPFTDEHAAELGDLAPRCRRVDGTMLFWHGVRMRQAFACLRGLGLGKRG